MELALDVSADGTVLVLDAGRRHAKLIDRAPLATSRGFERDA